MVHSKFNFFLLFIKLSNAGGRLIIASDGIWDALSSDTAAKSCQGLSAELAAKLVVKVTTYMGSFLTVRANPCILPSFKLKPVHCSGSFEVKRLEG